MVKIYTLQKLSEKLGTTENSIRVTMSGLRSKGKPLIWRGYRFFNLAGKVWIATEETSEIEIHD